jgi:hypothetical protein
VPVTAQFDSDEPLVLAVTGTSAELSAELVVGPQYVMVGTVDMWVKLADGGSTVTAVVETAGNLFLPAGVRVPISVENGQEQLAAVKATGASDGHLCVYRVAGA